MSATLQSLQFKPASRSSLWYIVSLTTTVIVRIILAVITIPLVTIIVTIITHDLAEPLSNL